MRTVATCRLELPGRPYTCNQARVWHFRRVATEAAYWRALAKAAAMNQPMRRANAIGVSAQSLLKGKRSRDTGAEYLAVKAAIDGLVDAKLIPDDTPEHLRFIHLTPPSFGCGKDFLVLDIEVLA